MMMATNDYRSRFYDRYSSNHASSTGTDNNQ